jgi:glucose/arabinose dehydrogenase
MLRQLSGAALLAALLSAGAAGSAAAQSNLETVGQMKTTGVKEFTFVEQGGTYAAAIRETLKRIQLPPGFKIELYAVVPDARHMAVGPQGVAVFVGTRKNDAWVVTDRNKDRVADEVKRFAQSLELTVPNGPCFSKDGFLYVAEQNRVIMYPAAEFFYEGPDMVAVPIVPQGKLIPVDEESYNHTARVCRIGPDDKLYISLGQPFNVFAPEKAELYDKTGIGGIIRMNRDGTGRDSTRPTASCGSPTTRWTAWATTFRRASSTARPPSVSTSASPGMAAAACGPTSTRAASRRPTTCSRRWRWTPTRPIWA